ncbi:MAG: class I SAM-dependent methyltransferase [Spirochaetia bacterium]
MDISSHRRLFNRIAFAYKWFFSRQVEHYTRIILQHLDIFGEPAGNTVLDVGCGTGAFTRAFEKAGFIVKGVDIAPKMVEAGRKRNLDCRIHDVTTGLPYRDDSFDFVTAAYVAHGLDGELRTLFFAEMKRLARKKVILHDYPQSKSFFTSLVERLEGGGYFSFISDGLDEMRQVFPKIRVIPVTEKSAWYVCEASENLSSSG